MSKLFSFSVLASLALLASCSTIKSKDCFKDMKDFGQKHGRMGSQVKYTDEISAACMKRNPEINLAAYEEGFYQGWSEYCLPKNALDMGKRADRYFSFCPAEREEQFREKYLIGKHINELREQEEDILDELLKVKPSSTATPTNADLYNKLKNGLLKTRQDIQALEVEGAQNNVKFR